MKISLLELQPLLPLGVLMITGILLLMYEVFSNQEDRTFCAHLSIAGSAIALYLTLSSLDAPTAHIFGAPGRAPLIVDAFSKVAAAVMIMSVIIATLLSPAYARNARHDHGEYYALLLFAVIGMIVMAMSGDLMTLFLGLETMSIAVYSLTGMRRGDPRSSEAALKYFLMGAFATGFLLFGIALIYGTVQTADGRGSTTLVDVIRHIRAIADVSSDPLFVLGVVLLMVGFGFKIAAVPFHMWAPDVYEGAPTPVTGFMAVGVKAAAFVGLLRIVIVGFGDADAVAHPVWVPVLSGLAIATIIFGNILALAQQSIKRMLAYSSISHAGYALIGVIVAARGEQSAGVAVLFYLMGYTFMTLGAFGVLAYLERQDGGVEAERFGAYAGVGYKHPALGIAMALFMIGLTGIPPTAGFFGKLYIFSAAIRAGETHLAFVGIAGSVISVYYYLRVLVSFYMREVPDPGPLPVATRSVHLALGLGIAALGVIHLGIFPGRWIELSKMAISSLVIPG